MRKLEFSPGFGTFFPSFLWFVFTRSLKKTLMVHTFLAAFHCPVAGWYQNSNSAWGSKGKDWERLEFWVLGSWERLEFWVLGSWVLWPTGVSCPRWIPSQPLAYTQPTHCDCWLVTNLNLWAAIKKINSIPAKPL